MKRLTKLIEVINDFDDMFSGYKPYWKTVGVCIGSLLLTFFLRYLEILSMFEGWLLIALVTALSVPALLIALTYCGENDE